MTKKNYSLPLEDLDHVFRHTAPLWEEARERQFFATGMTGFWGTWLLESFLWANDKLDLKSKIIVLTRNKEVFRKKAGPIADHARVSILAGDVRTFSSPPGSFPYIIHAAADARATQNENNPSLMVETIVDGTRRVLDFAAKAKCKKFLLASSGAVYGRQPPELTHAPEDYRGGPDILDPRSAYGEGKRMAELYGRLSSDQHGFECKIARGYAFSGPGLPLDEHFAIGNFMSDLLNKRPIEIKGDGTPFRSYLDAADLAVWLWTILFSGQNCHPYNVGSENALSILETANTVNALGNAAQPVIVKGTPKPGVPPERYVPSTQRAQKELGLEQLILLPDSLQKWKAWLQRDSKKQDPVSD